MEKARPVAYRAAMERGPKRSARARHDLAHQAFHAQALYEHRQHHDDIGHCHPSRQLPINAALPGGRRRRACFCGRWTVATRRADLAPAVGGAATIRNHGDGADWRTGDDDEPSIAPCMTYNDVWVIIRRSYDRTCVGRAAAQTTCVRAMSLSCPPAVRSRMAHTPYSTRGPGPCCAIAPAPFVIDSS